LRILSMRFAIGRVYAVSPIETPTREGASHMSTEKTGPFGGLSASEAGRTRRSHDET
jgi:hypothetical protein